MYWRALGRKNRKKKTKDWQQLLAQVPIFKEKKKRTDRNSIRTAFELDAWTAPKLRPNASIYGYRKSYES